MIRRPPRSTLFPYTNALPICFSGSHSSSESRNATCDVRTRASPAFRTSPSRPLCGSDTTRSEEHTSELQSQSNLVCRLLLEKKKHDRAYPGALDHEKSA